MTRYVVVDLETTGNVAKDGVDKIIQIAAVVIQDGEIHEVFSSFVNPERSIPPFITELTGIHDEMVQSAPCFQRIAPMVAELLKNSYFVAHNVHFDWRFLQEELRRAGYSSLECPVIDTVELARILFPTADSYKLIDLAKYLELNHTNPHRADSDAMVTAELFLQLCEKLGELPLVTLQSLYELSRSFKTDSAELLSSYILKKVTNDNSNEYDIYRNLALRKASYAVKLEDPPHYSFSEFSATIDTVLQQEMQGYEKRKGQQTMMTEIYEALRDTRFSLIEAGTGTGKTLAYLISGLFHAKEKEQPVVVSTHTIQLQQQILEKEVPLLKRLLPFPFEVALIKGRRHYLCLHRFEHALLEPDTNYDSVLTKAKILVWLLHTETGDVDELNLPSGGNLLWDRVCSDANSPSGKSNMWSSRCFYQRAKHRVYFADLIITNHAMFFQDMNNDDPLLSSYEFVVLDEAHHIEEVSSHALGEQFSCMQFQLLLSRIGTLETQDILTKVYETMEDYNLASLTAFKRLNRVLKDIKFESDELFHMLRFFLLDRNKHNQIAGNVRLSYRYNVNKEEGKRWSAITEAADRLVYSLAHVVQLCRKQEEIIQEHLIGVVIAEEFVSLVQSLETFRIALKQLLLYEQADGVTWMEAEAKGTLHSTVLYRQPVDVSEMLADRLFAKRKSVILTSATLTVNGTFDYIINSLGLSDFQPTTTLIPSPFHFEHQVQMMVPTDIPSIKDVSEDKYADAMAQHITAIAKVSKGRMLVLFTSYEMLRRTYASIKEGDGLQEFALLAQGINSGSRTRMTKSFQQFEKAILFGTSSFWEGIDIPGDALSCLVMVRLPFSPPNHPVVAAKAEQLKKKGENPFFELSLPQAIIRFKQGFGRLIRTNEDKGVVFVLDRRITTTFYGRRFLSSIPKVPVYEDSLEQLLEMMRS